MFLLDLLFVASVSVPAADYQLNFENLPGYSVPEEWKLDGWGYKEGYRSSLSSENAYDGGHCLSLYHEGDKTPNGNGRAYMQMEAGDFRGKQVAFRVAVRVVDAGCSARVRLHGLTRDKREVLIAGTLGDSLQNSDWKEFEMIGQVGLDIETLEMSLMHNGRGRVLIDDIELAVLGDLPSFKPQPATTLEERTAKNYVVLGRVLGVLQYYHPSDQAAAADWPMLARTGVLAVEDANDSNELCEILEAHFAAVAPTLRLYPKGKRAKDKPEWLEKPGSTDGMSVVRWSHTGLGSGERELFSSEREREAFGGKVPRGWLKPEKASEFDVGAFVTAKVATTLYADAEGTLPHTSDIEAMGAKPIEGEAGWSALDRATRISALLMAWNAIEHFSPLLEEVKVDWEKALQEAVVAAAADKTEEEFLSTLRRMIAKLGDGQARVEHRSEWRVNNIPVCWDWIEDKLVITRISKDESSDIGVSAGDVVLQLGAQTAEGLYRKTMDQFAGMSDGQASALALYSLRRRAGNERVTMRVNTTKGKSINIDYLDPFARAPMKPVRPAQFSEPKSGVVYVNLSRVSESNLSETLDKLSSAKAVVFDLRDGASPGCHLALLPHLISKATKDILWRVPVSTRPNRLKLGWEKLKSSIEPADPRIDAQLIFISDGTVSGPAETLLGLVAASKLGDIVGATSAGAIGSVHELELPGGYQLQWTGELGELPNGDLLHRKGIAPTVPAKRTITGAMAGRDDLLQAALGLVK